MLAYMNEEALARTIATGEAHYWSRSRGRLWRKGEDSGNTQRVVGDAHRLRPGRHLAEGRDSRRRGRLPHRAEVLLLSGRPARGRPSGGVSLRFVDAERQFDPGEVYRHAGAAKGTLKSSE